APAAVILAAGRGARLVPYTDTLPTALISIAGKPLVAHTLKALRRQGVEQFYICRGWQGEVFDEHLEELGPGVQLKLNPIDCPDFNSTGMLESLRLALRMVGPGPLYVCYGDIIFRPCVARRLLEAPGDLVAAVNGAAPGRQSKGFAEVESVSCVGSGGDRCVRRIGKGRRVREADATGEFAGLMKCTVAGRRVMEETLGRLFQEDASCTGQAWTLPWWLEPVQRASLCDLLQLMADEGVAIHVAMGFGGWHEVNTCEDLTRAWNDTALFLSEEDTRTQVKAMGSCLLSEANDLKRPLPIVAKALAAGKRPSFGLDELNVSLDLLECHLDAHGLLRGDLEVSDALDVVRKMSEVYAVPLNDLWLDADVGSQDTLAGCRVFSFEQAESSSRVLDRQAEGLGQPASFKPHLVGPILLGGSGAGRGGRCRTSVAAERAAAAVLSCDTKGSCVWPLGLQIQCEDVIPCAHVEGPRFRSRSGNLDRWLRMPHKPQDVVVLERPHLVLAVSAVKTRSRGFAPNAMALEFLFRVQQQFAGQHVELFAWRHGWQGFREEAEVLDVVLHWSGEQARARNLLVTSGDPLDPDIQMNNGHLMMQTTLFIGPVDFYWKDRHGKVHRREMNTGDSNYISPFVPHSFTARKDAPEAIIIAVTYGGAVRRAFTELSRVGAAQVARLAGDWRDPTEARKCLLKCLGLKPKEEGFGIYCSGTIFEELRRLAAECLSFQDLAPKLAAQNIPAGRVEELLEGHEASEAELEALALVLHVRKADLLVSPLQDEEEVVVTFAADSCAEARRSESYVLAPLARTRHQPDLKTFDLEVLEGARPGHCLGCGLHSFIYHFGSEPVQLTWGAGSSQILRPGDSAYVAPMVEHRFSVIPQAQQVHGTKNQNGAACGVGRHLLLVRIPGQLSGLLRRRRETIKKRRRTDSASGR
ncbi:Methylphosphonate synthase, partial [Durusdinium trenchii]